MNSYETLLLLSSQATASEIIGLEKAISLQLKKADGLLGSFDRWGKYRLAYAVRKQDYGIYVLVRYTVASPNVFFDQFKTYVRVKADELVLRYVHVKLTPSQYKASYYKPTPIDAESGDLDSFLKENKMEGLIGGKGGAKGPLSKKAVEAAPQAVDVKDK